MRRILCLVLALAVVMGTFPALAANAPIYVDGSGNGVIYDSAAAANAANGDSEGESGSSTDSAVTGTGTYELPTDDEEDEDDDGAVQKWEYTPSEMTATWNGRDVVVKSLGTVVSIVTMNNMNIEVYTRDLVFSPDVPEEKKLAIVNAPRNGRVSMHKRPNKKSAIIMKCQTCHIVPVYEITSSYARVQYEDANGYVSLNSLIFLPASQGTATIAYVAMNGNVNSSNTVNVRQEDSAAARILGELPCGQRVTLLQIGEKFSLIEAEGMRCYILNTWLTQLTDEQSHQIKGKGTQADMYASEVFLADTSNMD